MFGPGGQIAGTSTSCSKGRKGFGSGDAGLAGLRLLVKSPTFPSFMCPLRRDDSLLLRCTFGCRAGGDERCWGPQIRDVRSSCARFMVKRAK